MADVLPSPGHKRRRCAETCDRCLNGADCMTEEVEQAVYAGKLDYRAKQGWIEKTGANRV